MFNKVSKTIGLLRKFRKILPRSPLITVHISFIRPHVNYGDIVYDQACNVSFHRKSKSIQRNYVLAIIGSTGGTSRETLS